MYCELSTTPISSIIKAPFTLGGLRGSKAIACSAFNHFVDSPGIFLDDSNQTWLISVSSRLNESFSKVFVGNVWGDAG